MIISQNENTVTIAMPIEPPYFGMFSDEGNLVVGFIVDYHRANKNDWPTVYKNLQDLAKSDPAKYGEAMDTMVREIVYDTLGFETEFYI